MEKLIELIEATINAYEWRIENDSMTMDKSDYDHLDEMKKALREVKGEKTWMDVVDDWGGWSNAQGALTVKSFGRYLDENYQSPEGLNEKV